MTNNHNRNFRILFWVSSFVAIAALAGCLFLNHRLNVVKQSLAARQYRSRMPDPHAVSKHRDRDYEFVIHNYGFEYEGKTGNEIDDSILFCGAWEKDFAFFMRDFLLRLGNRQATFIDVGCNAGHHSLFLSPYVKQIHAFDPYRPALERFEKMITRNGFTNIVLHPVGLGAKEDTLPFFEPPQENPGVGSFRGQPETRLLPTERLRIVRGDDELAPCQLSDIELIKIDIEGFEESALLGLQKTLESHRPVVILEVTRPPSGTIASLAQLRSLFPAAYKFWVFLADENTCLNGRYILDDFAPQAGNFFATGFQANLVAFPPEKEPLMPGGSHVVQSR